MVHFSDLHPCNLEEMDGIESFYVTCWYSSLDLCKSKGSINTHAPPFRRLLEIVTSMHDIEEVVDMKRG